MESYESDLRAASAADNDDTAQKDGAQPPNVPAGALTPPQPRAATFWGDRELHKAVRKGLLETRQSRDEFDQAEAACIAFDHEVRVAEAVYEARIRADDPRHERPGELPLAVVIAGGMAAFDILPAWWGAQALGEGLWATRMITALLVISLTAFATFLSHFRHTGNKRFWWTAFGLAGAMIALQTGLRAEYLIVENPSPPDNVSNTMIAFEVALLAAVTLTLVWVGYIVLRRAEPVGLFKARWRVRNLERRIQSARDRLGTAAGAYSDDLEALRHHDRSRLHAEPQLVREAEAELMHGDAVNARRIWLGNGGPSTGMPDPGQ